MANYEFTVISNYFKVKNPQEVVEVLSKLGYEESYNIGNNAVCLASYETCWSDEHRVVIDKATKKMVAVINECDLDYFELDDAWISEMELTYKIDDLKDISITDYIQHQLLDNTCYCAIKEVGNEKLRYNIGVADVITKNSVKWFNLDRLIEVYVAEEMAVNE